MARHVVLSENLGVELPKGHTGAVLEMAGPLGHERASLRRPQEQRAVAVGDVAWLGLRLRDAADVAQARRSGHGLVLPWRHGARPVRHPGRRADRTGPSGLQPLRSTTHGALI